MARLQERLELLPCFSSLDLAVTASSGDIDRRVVVGVHPPATDPTAKRLLYWAIAPVDKMAALRLLRRVGAFHGSSAYATFGRPPRQLFGDMRQVGGVEIRVHAPRLEAHRGDIEPLEGDLAARLLAIQLVDRAVDLLPHRARQLGVARRGQALDALLLQTRPQLGLAATLLSVTLVALGKLSLEGPVLLAG